MRNRVGTALGTALWSVVSVGCGSSIAQTEHEARLEVVRSEYEARLVGHRRRADSAGAQLVECRAAQNAERERANLRVRRLESSLADQEGPRVGRPAGADATLRRGLRAAFEGVAGVEVEGDALRVIFEASALFAEGASKLTGAGRARVGRLADLVSATAVRVTVTGHTSRDLRSEDAWPLSAARSRAVVEALQAAGVDPSRLVLSARAGYASDPSDRGRVEVRLSTLGSLDGRRSRRD